MDDKTKLIGEICTAQNTTESLALYGMFKDKLEGCKFIFSSDSGAVTGRSVNHTFSEGSAIRTVFHKNKVLMLDNTTFEEMLETGKSQLSFQYSVGLDTQALSYLEPYINGKCQKLPKDFHEIFTFLTKENVEIDALPYLYENLQNLTSINKAERVFEKLKHYVILCTLDVNHLIQAQEVKSTKSEEDIVKQAQLEMSKLYQLFNDADFMESLRFRFNFEYWFLLKMVIINFEKGHETTFKKLMHFVGECDREIGTLSMRAIILAHAYFTLGQKLRFFKQIQKNSKDLSKKLKNMTWDLYHLRMLEGNLAVRFNADYFFPSLLTCDKSLIEIIELSLIKSCAFIEGSDVPKIFYENDWLEKLTDSKEELQQLEEFFVDEARDRRYKKHKKVRGNLNSMVETLEQELSKWSFKS